MNRLNYLPLAKVTNEKLGMEYTLIPKVYGYDTKTLKDSLNLDRAVLKIDVHLGLEDIPEKCDLLVSVVDYEQCKKHDHGLFVYKYDKVNDEWVFFSPEHIKKLREEQGYKVTIIKHRTGTWDV